MFSGICFGGGDVGQSNKAIGIRWLESALDNPISVRPILAQVMHHPVPALPWVLRSGVGASVNRYVRDPGFRPESSQRQAVK